MNKKILLMLIFQNVCFAIEPLYDRNEEISNILNSNPYTPNYLSMFVGLFVVIGLIYLTGFIYQKLVKVKFTSDEEPFKNQVQLLSSRSLGQGKNLHVVQVDNKKMLVGATQNNISLVCMLDDVDNKKDIDDKEC